MDKFVAAYLFAQIVGTGIFTVAVILAWRQVK